jgi:2-furoyl-CoA dehydrogenase FAD binding subunit
MKPPVFDYALVEDLDEVVELLAAEGAEARLLAGGQSLISMLNMRLIQPTLVVDISRLPDHDFITPKEGLVEIGCTVTQTDLQLWPGLAESLPLLKRALPWVGHRQTRNKGTVCGSVAHADPSAELPLCLAALNGEAVLYSSRGERVLTAHELQVGMLETACEPDEMIRALRFPRAETGAGYGFGEVAYRHGDFAIVAVAVVASTEGVRIAVGGVSEKPEVFEWPLMEDRFLNDALNDLAWKFGTTEDQHATAYYRRSLIRKLGRRVVGEALACVG